MAKSTKGVARVRRKARAAVPANGTQQGVVADWDTQATREACRRAAYLGEGEAMHDPIEPSGATRPILEDVVIEAFREDATRALNRVTAIAPGQQSYATRVQRSANPLDDANIGCGPGLESTPQEGHVLIVPVARIVMTVPSPSLNASTAENTRGSNSEAQSECMALIPF